MVSLHVGSCFFFDKNYCDVSQVYSTGLIVIFLKKTFSNFTDVSFVKRDLKLELLTHL